MTPRNPIEFVRQLANGLTQRAGNRVQLEDANGQPFDLGNQIPVVGPLTAAQLAAMAVAVTGPLTLAQLESASFGILPDQVAAYQVTVANGQSESAEVYLAYGNLLAIYPASAVEATTTNLALKRGLVSGAREVIRDVFNTRKTIPFTAGQSIEVSADEYKAMPYVSLVLETAAGVAVVQTADRVFTLIVGPVWRA